MCQSWMLFVQNRTTNSRARSAMTAYEMIKTHLRLSRSTNVPASGPNRMPGSRAASAAVARIVAEPVDCVIHQTSANEASPLPNNDKAWVNQKVKKVSFQ